MIYDLLGFWKMCIYTVRTYIHTYIHTYIIHIYVYTYIHSFMFLLGHHKALMTSMGCQLWLCLTRAIWTGFSHFLSNLSGWIQFDRQSALWLQATCTQTDVAENCSQYRPIEEGRLSCYSCLSIFTTTQRGRIMPPGESVKRLATTANHTHTWWHNRGPLSPHHCPRKPVWNPKNKCGNSAKNVILENV